MDGKIQFNMSQAGAFCFMKTRGSAEKKTAAVEPHTLRASEAKATRAQQAHTPGGVLSSLAPKHNPFSFATRVDACNMGLLRNTVRMDEAQVRGSFWVG